MRQQLAVRRHGDRFIESGYRPGRHRRRLVVLLAVAALVISTVVATGTGAAASPAGTSKGGGSPVSVLAPRAGAVIVAPTVAAAHTMRLGATLSIARRVGSLSVQLNGHTVGLPTIRPGRLGVLLDAADGLVVGQNLLWVSVGTATGPPQWVVPVRFVVGFRDSRALGVGLRLGAGTLPAATATLRLPSTGVDTLSVTLNGAPVRVPAGARVLDLAQLGAVRWGSNTLRVRLVMTDGRVDDWSRTFRLDPRRDVAVARLDGSPLVGSTVVLDAKRSLIVPGLPQARGVRWVLVRRPLLSHARLGLPHGSQVNLRLDVPGTYQVGLMVGSGPQAGYDLLTVSATDPELLVPLNTIAYKNGVPGVQVGKEFYPDPSPDPKAGAPPGLVQVLVLQRSSLGFVANETLNSTAAFESLAGYLQNFPSTDLAIVTHPAATGAMPADGLSSLDTGLRAIGGTLPAKWTYPARNCWAGFTAKSAGPNTDDWGCLNPQNSSQWLSWQRSAFNGGSFTVIGVPGLAVGQAWRETAAQTGGPDGRIDGYLTKGVATGTGDADYYTVINGGSQQYASIDTCTNADGNSCTVSFGSTVAGTYSAGSTTITNVNPPVTTNVPSIIEGPGIQPGTFIVTGAPSSTLTISKPTTDAATGAALTVTSFLPPPAANGLHVVVLDRTTLVRILDQTVTSTTDLLSALRTTAPSATVGHFLPSPGMDDQRLVIIQSVGDGHVSGTASTSLLQYLDELGGTPDLLPGILAGQKYALVGAATDLPWRNASALESSAAIPVIPGANRFQTGKVSGALERDRDGLYAPLAGDPIDATNTDLYRILYQPAQLWPYAEDTRELAYIANNIDLGAYPDVRSAYSDSDLASSWDFEARQLMDLSCTDPSECGPNFQAVKNELLKEFPWVPKVYQFGTNLLKPYVQVGGATYFDVAQVTNQIKNSLPVPTSSSVKMKWLSIMSDLMSVASGLATAAGENGLSTVFGLISSAGTLATDAMQQPDSNGGPADAVTSTAEHLADQMAQQTAAYAQWVDQMEGILLDDYGKLSAVGTAIGNNPAWKWQSTTTGQAITALQANATASAYSALEPVAWPGYNLTPDFKFQFDSNDVSTLSCAPPQNNHSFIAALPQNQFHAITSIAGNGGAVDQVWTFATLNGHWINYDTGTRGATLPPTSQTDYIYGPYATGHSQNGTWYFGAYQYAPVWWRDTYDPPGFVVCNSEGRSGNFSWAAQPGQQVAPPPP
jgi:hypothetical protein